MVPDYKTNTNTLGPETEWVIGHGCNAVTVATKDGSQALSLGVHAWLKSWNGLHLVLGHYNGIDTSVEPDLKPFATSLKAGTPIKTAYFDAHKDDKNGEGHQAVIAASPQSCCNQEVVDGVSTLVCPSTGCAGDFIHTDKWTANNQTDLQNGQYYFVTEWSVAE
ncbi:MAG: hypothetical protein HN348_30595 [Proteobacteria bacterium]|nr:hypothetical protein [Pseudomonadota bacterium]